MTLKELMGDATRGDGRRFAMKGWDNHEWFEPIFLAKEMWNGLYSDNSPVWWHQDVENWQEYVEPKKES